MVCYATSLSTRVAVHVVHTVHKGTRKKTLTSQLLQIIYNTDARVPSLPLKRQHGCHFIPLPKFLHFLSLSAETEQVFWPGTDDALICKILTRSRRLSCTCAKYPAVGGTCLFRGCEFFRRGGGGTCCIHTLLLQKAKWKNIKCQNQKCFFVLYINNTIPPCNSL